MKTLALFLVLIFAVLAWGRGSYTGYSGSPGRQTCAISCHGTTGGTIQVLGFPANYTPGQQYLITVKKTSGSTIRNFNASCRVGTGTTNAGTITAGLYCSVYNVTGETNGVHYTSTNHDSGQFTWTAPLIGTGTVRLYLGGQQGSSSGANTVYVGVSNETVGNLPGAATNPFPANSATQISPATTLQWNRGTNATSYDVLIGSTNPPPTTSLTNITDTVQTPTGLTPGTTYYWRVDSRNASGVTTGTVWSFTTFSIPTPQLVTPVNGDTVFSPTVPLQWALSTTPDLPVLYLYLSQTNPPTLLDSLGRSVLNYTTDSLQPGTYYWRLRQVYPWLTGQYDGPVWSFTVEPVNGVSNPAAIPSSTTLTRAYPNPFNPTTIIEYSIRKPGDAELRIFDLSGNEVARLATGFHSTGTYTVTWDGSNAVSGTYFYRFTTNGQTVTGRLLLLK